MYDVPILQGSETQRARHAAKDRLRVGSDGEIPPLGIADALAEPLLYVSERKVEEVVEEEREADVTEGDAWRVYGAEAVCLSC